MTDVITLPDGPFQARLKVEMPGPNHKQRFGRVTIETADGQVSATQGGMVLRAGEIAEVAILGQEAWVVRTTEDERWLIQAIKPCGCGGG